MMTKAVIQNNVLVLKASVAQSVRAANWLRRFAIRQRLTRAIRVCG